MNQALSKSPLSGVSYPVPTEGDSEGIENFISSNNSPVVAVQGLGFVGFVMSLVVASSQKPYAVIGVDKDSIDAYWKIPEINKGICPIVSSDPLVSELFEASLQQGNFYATHDSNAFKHADVIIVDINLDVTKENNSDGDLLSFDVPLESFKKAIESIGSSCKEDVLILVETTVPPGTCRKIVYPIIVENLKSRGLDASKFKLGHSYERVMPGPNYVNSIKNFYRVYSGINAQSADAVEKFLKTVISTDEYPLTRLKTTESTEMAKVLENSYRAMNISFMVEWSRFAEESGVNLYDVINAIRMRPTHSNLMYPGIGVGGYCLTKDPLLASWSRKNNFDNKKLFLSERGVEINDKMPFYSFNYFKKAFNIENLNNKKILFLGISYRSDVGDTRFSPVEPFFKFCLNEGADIKLHDPFLNYWEETNSKVEKNLKKALMHKYDIVIFSTSHTIYKNSKLLIKILSQKTNIFIYDSIGILNHKQIKKLNKKNKVKILGRGDI